MSDHPASLGDLADVEANLQNQITKLKSIVEGDSAVTDEKISSMRVALAAVQDSVAELVRRVSNQEAHLLNMNTDVARLHEIWRIAKRNPELIRELALNVLLQDE